MNNERHNEGMIFLAMIADWDAATTLDACTAPGFAMKVSCRFALLVNPLTESG